MGRVSGKVIIVTGGASGLAKADAVALSVVGGNAFSVIGGAA